MFSAGRVRAFSLLLTTRTATRHPMRSRPLVSSRMSSSDGDGPTVIELCQQKIETAMNSNNVKVTAAFDDPNGAHISIEVVSPDFEGKRAVQRQQLVYKAIWEELNGGPVHAVDNMICQTPDEAKAA